MAGDRPFFTEARIHFWGVAIVLGLAFAGVSARIAWNNAHPPTMPAPEPKRCVVIPLRGSGGMVTRCEPDLAAVLLRNCVNTGNDLWACPPRGPRR